MIDYEHRGLCREIALPTSGVERMRITNEGAMIINSDFWKLPPEMTSTAAKLRAIGIFPDFLDATTTMSTAEELQKELEEIREDYDALESGSLSLEEMEKHWAEATKNWIVEDFVSRSLVQTLPKMPRVRKHLSSR